jgi:hypothetical protein
MEQLLIKIRGIVNNNKQQKTRAFYSVVYAQFFSVPDFYTGVIEKVPLSHSRVNPTTCFRNHVYFPNVNPKPEAACL